VFVAGNHHDAGLTDAYAVFEEIGMWRWRISIDKVFIRKTSENSQVHRKWMSRLSFRLRVGSKESKFHTPNYTVAASGHVRRPRFR
jgi:hypothetical protein